MHVNFNENKVFLMQLKHSDTFLKHLEVYIMRRNKQRTTWTQRLNRRKRAAPVDCQTKHPTATRRARSRLSQSNLSCKGRDFGHMCGILRLAGLSPIIKSTRMAALNSLCLYLFPPLNKSNSDDPATYSESPIHKPHSSVGEISLLMVREAS